MDVLKDALSGNVVAVAVAGTAALLLPAVAPALAPPLRNALKLGIGLFLESAGEAEGQLMQELVQDTMEGILEALRGPGTRAAHRHAAAEHVEAFEAKARRRAARFGFSKRERAARYRRQVEKLKRELARAKHEHPHVSKPALDHVAGMISEDW